MQTHPVAKHRNGKGSNKKTRGMPDVMSHKKHRTSGKKGRRNSVALTLDAAAQNRNEAARREMCQRRRPTMYSSVQEAMQKSH